MHPKPTTRRRACLIFLCWLLFAAGLLLQFFAPQLKISNGKFVIPERLTDTGGAVFDPITLVRKERTTKGLSAALAASGALGLTFFYWGTLTGRGSRKETEQNEQDAIGKVQQQHH